MKFSHACLFVAGLSVLSGCAEEPLVDDEFAYQTEDALITGNALTGNALTGNALTGNALTGNALTGNALTGNALTGNVLAALQDPTSVGTLNREFARYMVACAFATNQALEFSWTDADGAVHNEHFDGQLGLAPHWNNAPLGQAGKHMVTACLASKVNYYGTSVTISVRSGEAPLKLHPNDDELDEYPNVEGAFWGNLWAPTPYINACYNSTNRANSRAHLRDCAAGHVNPDGSIEECGIINIVGSCANVCKKYSHSRGYYEDCRKNPGVNNKRTDLVITTALP